MSKASELRGKDGQTNQTPLHQGPLPPLLIVTHSTGFSAFQCRHPFAREIGPKCDVR